MIKPTKPLRDRLQFDQPLIGVHPDSSSKSGVWTSHYQRVIEAGMRLPKEDHLSDDSLSRLLWKLISKLAELRVYLAYTDHLSDRALYKQLTEEALHDPIADVQPTGDMAYLIGLIGSERRHLTTYLRYYASDAERCQLAKNFGGVTLPPRGKPPFDRDRLLPRP